MNHRLRLACALGITIVLSGTGLRAEKGRTTGDAPPKTSQAWTLEEARRQIALNPHDPYLQYVALQLARNENRTSEVAGAIEAAARRTRRGVGRDVDLFALFTGALAVQESLQLDAMRATTAELAGPIGDRSRETVKTVDLAGPQVRSHPWGKMLAAQTVAGKTPEVSPLAMCVPEDQYFVLFGSVDKVLEASDVGDLWGAHLFSQAVRSAKTQQTNARLKTQLAVQTDPLSRPFYDMVIEEVAITGRDLYFRTGSDVTLLFQVKQPEVFRLRMDGFLAAAEQSRPDAVRTTGKVLGVEYVQIATPDRDVHVFSAYPRRDLHVRSNSKAALKRVLETIVGRSVDGRREVRPLGSATEFKYIRTLMPRGAKEEDGFVYLSDPFIRRLVGAELKLTQSRRLLCYNHLRMIGHAAMLYRTQYGRPAESLDELAVAGCAPRVFGEGKFQCPCGGEYALSEDATTGVCSHHGHARHLVPCCEVPVARVTEVEAKQYRDFVERYNRYWQRFFDPIAIRLQLTPNEYRAETIILPLIDNSVYSGMAMALGGEPEPLDALPVPERNIFSMAVRVNKERWLKDKGMVEEFLRDLHREGIEIPPGGVTPQEFLLRGIGNQIGMHVYDASPFFDFNLTGFLGEMMGSFRGGRGGFGDEMIPIGFLIASLNSPVYVAVPVKDAKIVDGFLDQLDGAFAELARQPQRGGFLDLDFDFYRVPLETGDERIRCYNVRFGPIKWRVFFARIGDGLYIASKRFILDDLAAAGQQKADRGPAAHAMVRVRPEHWDQVLPDFQLGWAESSRQSCLNNLGPLSSVARAAGASTEGPVRAAEVCRQADELHGVHFFCPDGGRYELSPDGTEIVCTAHGSAQAPRQMPAPAAGSPMGRLMQDFSGVTAALTFLEDGLHAVVTVKRQ